MNVQRANVAMIALIGLLVIGLCANGIQRWRLSAARTETANHLRILGIATNEYHDNRKFFPPIFGSIEFKGDGPAPMPHAVSFHVHLLPFVGQTETYATFLTDGKGKIDAHVPAFENPTDGTLGNAAGVQCFAANLRTFSAKGLATPPRDNMPELERLEPGRVTFRSFMKGTSTTITLAPKLAECGSGGSRYAADPTSPYAAFFGQNVARTTAHYADPNATYQWAPRGSECLTTPLMAQSYLPESLPVAFADGSVCHIKGNINPGLWNRAQSPRMDD